MALIYRSIFEVEDPDNSFIDRVPVHIQSWLRYKLRDSGLSFALDDVSEVGDCGVEITPSSGANDECSVVRIEAFEGARDDGVDVKTTLTAIREPDRSWAWIDLERWTHGLAAPSWIPVPPGIVVTLLLNESATRGGLTLSREPGVATGDEGEVVAEIVLDRDREIPLIVVSYNERENEGAAIAEERGRVLAKRLAGVASVYVLGKGAVTAFSRAMHQALGEGMDVYSGAVRTYLPGVGSDPDYPARHRFIAYRTLVDRRADVAALMVAPGVFRRAAESPPPPIWRAAARSLLIGHPPDTEYGELLSLAEEEIAELRASLAEVRDSLDVERSDNVEFQRRNDDLARRVVFLRQQVQERSPEALALEPHADVFQPVLCKEVIDEARTRLEFIEIPEDVIAGAEALDVHGDESWASRAWSALQALDNYARIKLSDGFEGSFLTYCERSAGEFVIPAGWVVPTESAQTLAHRRFRQLRVLPVATGVDPSGAVLMPEHIRIEPGGTPSPRIHYFDDTRGKTKKIHVGWFGDHLDSRAKS